MLTPQVIETVPDSIRSQGPVVLAHMRPIDRVRGEMNQDFRSAGEIAERTGLSLNAVGAPLGMLRRNGEVEGMLGPGPRRQSLWRKASGGGILHGPRSGERGGAQRDSGATLEGHPWPPRRNSF